MKKIGKLEVKKIYPERQTREYYTQEHVFDDLWAFVKKAAGKEHPTQLSTGNINSIRITCSDGEPNITGNKYLNNAAVAFGYAKNYKEANLMQAQMLKELKKIAGFELRKDREYYTPENVLHDLWEFAKTAGLEHPMQLGRGNVESTGIPGIKCSNGEPEVRGSTYLNNAAIAFGYAKGSTEASSMLVQMLKELKKIAGFIIRDKEYYENPDYVKKDLESWATILAIHPTQLNARNISKINIICSNNEHVINGASYLRHAAILLGFAENHANAHRIQYKTFQYILKISGFQTLKEIDYYIQKNIKIDLESWANVLSLEPTQLNISYQTRNVFFTCANGRKVKARYYLDNAAVTLGLTKNTSEAAGKRKKTLRTLIEIAGFEIPKIRDKKYYENQKNVKQDFEYYANILNIHPLQLSTKNLANTRITCSNGEPEVTGQRYLNNAAVALGYAKGSTEAISMLSQILKELKKIAGFIIRDKEYYENSDYVKKDLESWATILGILPVDLNLSPNHLKVRITCNNGEPVNCYTYIRNAGIRLGIAKNSKEAGSMGAKILKKLKKIAGFKDEKA